MFRPDFGYQTDQLLLSLGSIQLETTLRMVMAYSSSDRTGVDQYINKLKDPVIRKAVSQLADYIAGVTTDADSLHQTLKSVRDQRVQVVLLALAGGEMVPALQMQLARDKTLPSSVTFTRASTGTYYGADGLLKTATTNEARFDHDPSTGVSKGLLIEEARTNLLLNATIDGANLATQSITTTASARTLSFYGTGTVTLSGTHSATVVGTGAYPTRTTYTYTPTSGTLTLTVTGTVQYANDELGSFATSFIPTAGASATRAVDVASMTGTNFSSWYNQTEGTFVVSADKTASGGAFPIELLVSDNSVNNYLAILHNSAASYRRYATVALGGAQQVAIDTADSAFAFSTIVTSAFGYKTNDFAFSRSGEVAQIDTSGTVPAVDRLHFGQRHDGAIPINGHIARITYFPTRLSNTTLQALSQ